jgi:hypothetical protein
VNPLCARLGEAPRWLDWVVVVMCLRIIPSLNEPDATTAADVNGRVEEHERRSRRRIRRRLRRLRRLRMLRRLGRLRRLRMLRS